MYVICISMPVITPDICVLLLTAAISIFIAVQLHMKKIFFINAVTPIILISPSGSRHIIPYVVIDC